MTQNNFYNSRETEISLARERVHERIQNKERERTAIKQKCRENFLERQGVIPLGKKTICRQEYILLGKHLAGNPGGYEWIASRGNKFLVDLAKEVRENEPNGQSVIYTIKPYGDYLSGLSN